MLHFEPNKYIGIAVTTCPNQCEVRMDNLENWNYNMLGQVVAHVGSLKIFPMCLPVPYSSKSMYIDCSSWNKGNA